MFVKFLLKCSLLTVATLACSTVWAKDCSQVSYPLSTQQQYIVDAAGCKVLLKSVNWFGGEAAALTPGGLDKQPLAKIIKLIKDGGFNSVRLPWANEMVAKNPVVERRLLKANPQLQGKKALVVFDDIIDALGNAGLMVVLDNHRSRGDWCCDADHGDGLWYSQEYSPESYFEHWLFMVKRYQDRPFVVAAELRNEIRPDPTMGLEPTWGSGDAKTDWKAAATKAGNLILKQNPNLLIMIGGLRWQVDLTEVKTKPVKLDTPHKLVYVAHDYVWNHPPENLSNPQLFAATAYKRWGFVLEPNKPYTAPLYLSEWGGCTQLGAEGKPCPKDRYQFVEAFKTYLCSLGNDAPVSWAYWPLNGTQMAGYKRTEGEVEAYGLLKPDWQTWASPKVMKQLNDKQCGPVFP
ncbi:cellulase family glycosylhydrolase [Shewanella sp. Isolate11]|uniref:glycoside hydrolase family 5 protein n=1 Tax=Shewanella sp. Isolate11 TaxID=2908530 RepID=UPI001EFCD8C9|nr:cellulase family glycosylhydrolase [Shewanella sp. Isolate11]MCG9697927.1 glycoside hydrolase family 5 protein [Shewanella sp. Isolate11]